jgi:hypothetical protein
LPKGAGFGEDFVDGGEGVARNRRRRGERCVMLAVIVGIADAGFTKFAEALENQVANFRGVLNAVKNAGVQ